MQYGIWDWLRTWWWAWLLILTGHLLIPGCAAEMAARESVKTAGLAATVLANKIPIESGEMDATGGLLNPKWTILAGSFNGILSTVQLEGVEVRGRLAGRGTGGSNTVDPELAAIIERSRANPNGMLKELADYAYRLRNTEAPP